MRISLKWLGELVDHGLSVGELADRLDMTGTEVDAVETVGESLDRVVVGRVVTREPHPDADRLSYCKVDVGDGEERDIVCGADDFGPGDKVPVALPGAELPNGTTIKKSKIRGCVSEGMMCSPIELGTGADASGLLILPEDAPVGVPYAEYAGKSDVVLDLEVTPNRPDCLSVAGMAREIAAITGSEARRPSAEPVEEGPPTAESVDVRIEESALCPRYTARVIRGVTIGPSPEWLQERIIASGARPVNNIVDATNYVMFELGQPLHAFDMRTIGTAAEEDGGRTTIIVRRAEPGETLETLDHVKRELTDDMIVIADPDGPIALAGVMGGAHTEVSDDTADIVLESASFDPAHVSRTSRNLSLISEASQRFEKRVDPEGCAAAADRAMALIAEIAGGTVDAGIVDEYPLPPEPVRLELRVDRMNDLLGTSIDTRTAADILRRLQLEVSAGDTLSVSVPSFRPDLEREIDLVEEVVRVWGMDSVASTLPSAGRAGGLTRDRRWRDRVGEAMREAGLNEAVTYSFIDPEDVGRLRWEFAEGERPVRMLNPMSEEQSVLRWTIAAPLVEAVAHNQRRDVPDVRLYEMGKVFVTSEGRKLPTETRLLAGVLAGSWHRPIWNDPAEPLEFFDGKGVIETLMEALRVSYWRLEPTKRPHLQPGRAAEVMLGDRSVGYLGEMHPEVLGAYGAEGPVTLFELEVEPLVEAAVDIIEYAPLPKYPAVNLDVAFVVPEDVTAGRIRAIVEKAAGRLLESARLFDLYTGEHVEPGHKSMAFSLTYRAPDRTLTDEEVAKVHEKVVRKVTKATGGRIRG